MRRLRPLAGIRNRSLAVGAAIAAMIAVTVPTASAQTESSAGSCRDVSIPVSVVPLGERSYSVYGKLCQPRNGPSSVISILVPGYSYDHTYWDMPGFDGKYRFTEELNKAGYTTLAIDRIGTGRSSRPPSALLTVNSNAQALHDIVQAVRSHRVPDGPYDRVVLGGHSFGTATSILESATYGDVDGIIATGADHLFGPTAFADLMTSLQPALLDERLRKEVGADAGYLTTLPDARKRLFHNPDNTDPAIIAHDEATKDTGTALEITTVGEYVAVTPLVQVPTLQAVGQNDYLMCAQGGGLSPTDCASSETFLQVEKPFWSPKAELEAYVLPKAGHNMNVALNAHQWYQRAVQWLQTHFPTETR